MHFVAKPHRSFFVLFSESLLFSAVFFEIVLALAGSFVLLKNNIDLSKNNASLFCRKTIKIC